MVSRLDRPTESIMNGFYKPGINIQENNTQSLKVQIDDDIKTKEDSIMLTIIDKKYLECKNIFIDSLNSETYKLKKPIPVTIEYDNKNYIARNYDLGLYGYGDTEIEALDYLKELIVETYEELKDENNLSSTLKLMMIYCKEIIEKKYCDCINNAN